MPFDQYHDEISMLFSDGDAHDELYRDSSNQMVNDEIYARWLELCDLIDSDQYKNSVSTSVVIDFPFKDMSNNGLKLEDGLLERAWFFKFNRSTMKDLRFVLHGHTFMKWSTRLKTLPSKRAAELTSVNMRLAFFDDSAGRWQQMKHGQTILPTKPELKNSWKSYYFNQGLLIQEDIQWRWSIPSHIPRADTKNESSKKMYERIRKLLMLAEESILKHVPIIETGSVLQTNKKIRGSSEEVHEMEIFAPPDVRIETDSFGASSTYLDSQLKIQNEAARAFWMEYFFNSESVPWNTFLLALKEEYPQHFESLEVAGINQLRSDLDPDNASIVTMSHYNIFTKKASIEVKLERIASSKVHDEKQNQTKQMIAEGIKSLGSGLPNAAESSVSILFLGANNSYNAELQIKLEAEKVQECFTKLHGAVSWKENLTFFYDVFADVQSLINKVQANRPTILHFACHGNMQGL